MRVRTKTAAAGISALALLATIGAFHAGAGQSELRSGGAAVSHRDGKAVGSSPARARLFGLDHQAVEPTIAMTKDGSIYYAAANQPNPIPRLVDLLVTRDKGKTWEVTSPRLADRNLHPVTLDPYVYVDERTDRLFSLDLTVACSYLSFSDDGGETWIHNPLACGRPVNDHQTLFSGPRSTTELPGEGFPNNVYYCWNDIATSSCSKSLDGGITWIPTGSPAFPGRSEDGEVCGGLHGHGVVGNDGTVYLPREYCDKPFLAISKDEGLTWERVQISKMSVAPGQDPSVAVDRKGNIYYAFPGRDRLPYLSVSTKDGKTWSKPVMLGAPKVKETNLLTIDVGDPGKVAYAYYGSENSPYPVCSKTDAGCHVGLYVKTTWNGYLGYTTDALSDSPVFTTASVNHRSESLKNGQCGPGRCADVWDFIDVIVGNDGVPYGAYVDACVNVCTQTNSTGGEGVGVFARLDGAPKLQRK